MKSYISYNMLLNVFKATTQTNITNIIQNQLTHLRKYKRIPRKLKKYWKTKTLLYELYKWVKKYDINPNDVQVEIKSTFIL